mmetsp:Transcript_24005/g.72010  ORF Transcript_24005/g.72010 Transcript_24005/m.72010 type:complete len:227 (-) Transcript_24005:31-711(-)
MASWCVCIARRSATLCRSTRFASWSSLQALCAPRSSVDRRQRSADSAPQHRSNLAPRGAPCASHSSKGRAAARPVRHSGGHKRAAGTARAPRACALRGAPECYTIAPTGMAWRSGPRAKAHATDVELGLRQNSEHLDALSEQVAMLKGLTAEIDEEVKAQNSFLETMGSGMGGAGSALSRTMAALDQMTTRGGARFGLLVAIAVVAFFALLRYGLMLGAAPVEGAP